MNWFTDKLYDLGASPRAGEAAWGELAAQDAMSPRVRANYYEGLEMPKDPRAAGWRSPPRMGDTVAPPSDSAWMLPPEGPVRVGAPSQEVARRFGASGLTPPPARSAEDAYRMAGLAATDRYEPNTWRDIDREAIEDQYGGADIHGIKLPPVSRDEPRAWRDAIIGETPADALVNWGLGGTGRAAKAALALGGLFKMADPAEAKPKIFNTLSRLAPTAEDIAKIKGAAVQFGRRGWPTAEREVFSTDPAAYAETLKLVPQVSIKDRLPGPLPGEALPIKERAAPIVASTEPIAERIAQRLEPLVEQQSPLLKFYHTGPVIRGLERYGEMGVPEANTFMRDWAGQGAATSPRTQTPPNLRNSSYLLYERASGNPLTPERYGREGNVPGFPMMGMHVDLADKFARGVENPWKNPKPTTFRENWSGNLPDVTGDTHNIRSTLFEMDNVAPGSLPRPWFSSDEAYTKYRKEGFGAVNPGDIVDTLGSKTVKGVDRQSEYLPMTEPWYRAAQKLGIHPAEAQSGGWFSYGDITGLQSPPKTIVNLLNDQVDATAKVLDVSPEKVVNWWARGKIPLAGVGGAAVMGGLADQSKYNRGD